MSAKAPVHRWVRRSAALATRSRRAATPTAPARPGAAPTEASLARALAGARGRTDAAGRADAAREVKELLGEGQRPERIAARIEAVRRRAERSAARESP